MTTADRNLKVLTVYGTRPEAIKLAPLITALEDAAFDSVTVVSGQHRHMLGPVTDLFGLTPNHDLDVFEHGMGLNQLASKVFARLDSILADESPDVVVVQGDTSTSAVSSIAAMYRSIPVVHLEAGLRSFNLQSPFPEEANRRLTSQITSLHLAPTPTSKANLLREGIAEETIRVTGNTVIDALQWVLRQPRPTMGNETLERLIADRREFVLVTAHRRENWGEGMVAIATAIATLAQQRPDTEFVIPAHRNPLVKDVFEALALQHANVLTIEPLDYLEFTHTMAAARLILTDSGGVQEEAPSIGKPVLVMRENTERPEAVDFGTVRLVGTDTDLIIEQTAMLLDDPDEYGKMANAVNPYGDGKASLRSVAAIQSMFGIGEAMADFDPVQSSGS